MNDTTFDFEYRSAIKMFEEQAALHPDRDAVVSSRIGLSYEMLNELANKVANSLLFLRLQREESVMVFMPRTLGAYIAELGILKAGGALVFANTEYPDDRVDFMFTDSGARYVLTTKTVARERTALFKRMNMTPLLLEQLVTNPNAENPGIEPDEHQLAYTIYTSGSTGKPKGVMLEHGNLTNFLQHNPKNTETMRIVERGQVMLAMAPLTFDVSIMEAFIALTSGMTLAMVTEAEILSPEKMKQFILTNKVDAVCATPTYINTLASIPDMHEALAQLKVIDIGAEAFPGALYTKLRDINPDVLILNGYGPTETTISCTVKELTSPEHITIGKPNGNVYAYVVDEELKEVPHGEEGELLICGKGVGRGYRNLPEKTAEVFVEYKGMRAYRTGDLVRLDANDEIEFVGRKDFQVKLRGLRIELGEIEEVVSKYPSVQNCAAVAVDNRFLVAYYTASNPIDPATIKEYAKQSLAHYMVPDIFMQLDTMPMNANQKIDRKALPRPEIQAEEIVPPMNDTQKKILEIFSGVIDGMPQSITANILELGVSSLDAMVLIAKLADTFGCNFKIADIYENPTVVKLEAFIAKAPKKVVFADKDKYPVTKLQALYYRINRQMPDDSVFNVCFTYQFAPAIDIARLGDAVTKAVDAHRALLTHFVFEDGQLWQIPAATDIHLIPEVLEIGDEAFDAIQTKHIHHFDLTQTTPALTARIYLTPTRRFLVLDMHHILIDGESLEILIHEIAAAYEGRALKGEAMNVCHLAEEQLAAREEEYANCRDFFNALIPQLPKMRSLTPSKPDPNGNMMLMQPVSKPGKELDAFCNRAGVSPSVLFYGLFGLLTSSEEKLHDAVQIFTFNSRNDTRLTTTVGLLISHIPVYCHWTEEMQLVDYLRGLQEQILHSLIFANTAEDVMKERYAATTENLVIFQPEGTDNFEIDGTTAIGTEILSPNGVLPYKTLTQLYTMGGMYQLVLAYDKTAYCAEHMTRLACKLDKLFVNADENITMGELLERAENEE